MGKVRLKLWQGERNFVEVEKSFVAHDCELWETEKILSVKMSENLTFLVCLHLFHKSFLRCQRRYKVMLSPCAAVCCADEWIFEIFSPRDVIFVDRSVFVACRLAAKELTVNSHLHVIINTLTHPSLPHSCGIEEVTGTRALNKLVSWSSTAQKCRLATLKYIKGFWQVVVLGVILAALLCQSRAREFGEFITRMFIIWVFCRFRMSQQSSSSADSCLDEVTKLLRRKRLRIFDMFSLLVHVFHVFPFCQIVLSDFHTTFIFFVLTLNNLILQIIINTSNCASKIPIKVSGSSGDVV